MYCILCVVYCILCAVYSVLYTKVFIDNLKNPACWLLLVLPQCDPQDEKVAPYNKSFPSGKILSVFFAVFCLFWPNFRPHKILPYTKSWPLWIKSGPFEKVRIWRWPLACQWKNFIVYCVLFTRVYRVLYIVCCVQCMVYWLCSVYSVLYTV